MKTHGTNPRTIFSLPAKIILPPVILQFFMTGGYALSFPYLAIYLKQERGIPFWMVGSFLAASLALAALGRLIGGAFADKIGRRPVLVFGIVIRTICVALVGLAIAFKAAFPVIIVIDFIGGLAAGGFNAVLSVWVSDQFNEYSRARAYSAMRTIANLGWAVGPAIAGFAVGHDYSRLFFGTAGIYLLCSIGIVFYLKESHPLLIEGKKPQHPLLVSIFSTLRQKKLLRFFCGTFLIGAVMGHLVVPLSLYASQTLRLSPRQIGLLFSLNGGMVVCFQLGLIHALREKRLAYLLGCGALAYALGYLLLGFAVGVLSLELCVAIITLGEMAVSPAISALAANLSLPHERGRALGATGFFHQAGYSLSPLIGGLGLQFFSQFKPCPYWFFVGALAIGAAWAFFGVRDFQE